MPLNGSMRKRLRRDYGITLEIYFEMLQAQGRACLICRSSFDEINKPHVDHCHTTGAVRGILCRWCNQGLGMFRDEPDRMRQAAIYIEHSRAEVPS